MENLSTILNWIFGGTSLVGLMTTFFFWGKSKRKEEAQTQMQEAQVTLRRPREHLIVK